MPTSFLSADAGFPRLTADIPAEERLNRIQNYLYMLLEQLRYALYNLGKDNFNEADLQEIAEEIQGPVLSVVSDLEGNVSILEQTASSLTTQISNAQGDISTLQQTASGLMTAVSNLGGDISVVSQKADRIDWIVASGTSASNMTLTSEAIDLVAQGINITGYVTFNSLETAGSSEINGNNVLLKADQYGDSTSYLEFLNSQDHFYGSLRTIDRTGSTNPYDDDVMFLIEAAGLVDGTYCGLRLNSGRSVVVDAGDYLNLVPGTQLVMNCGSHPVIIQADTVSYAAGWCPYGCYSFCNDGIYYGNTKVVSV